MKYTFIILYLALFSYSAFAQQHSRWAVKTLTDNFNPEMYEQVFSTPENFAKPPRAIVGDTTSRLEKEKAVVLMVCKVVKKTLRPDGNI